jgi:hypothetical protein
MHELKLIQVTTMLVIGLTVLFERSAIASEITIYYNPPNFEGGNCNFDTGCAQGDDFAAQIFTLTTTETITAASFSIFRGPVLPYAANWMFYEANGPGGLPGTKLAAGSSLNGVFDIPPSGYGANQENFNLSSSVTLAPGDYYFAIQAVSYLRDNYLSTASFPGTAETHDGGATWVANYAGFGYYNYGVAVGLYNGTFSGRPYPVIFPEPSTWAMMLLGFVGLGYAGYRKARTGSAERLAANPPKNML